MKMYIIKEEEFEALLAALDRDPRHGQDGGGSIVLSKQDQEAHNRAHRFYNYQVRSWVNKVKQ